MKPKTKDCHVVPPRNDERNTLPSSPFGGRGAVRGAVYIAGRVTGEDRLECAAKFAAAQQELRRHGFQTINPLEVVGSWDTPWEEAMKLCLKALLSCGAIYLLPCATNSKGAKIEVELAAKLGIPVSTQISSLKPFGRSRAIASRGTRNPKTRT